MGLRYHTPVGPIRFDFSYNLNPPIYPVNINYSIPTLGTNPLGPLIRRRTWAKRRTSTSSSVLGRPSDDRTRSIRIEIARQGSDPFAHSAVILSEAGAVAPSESKDLQLLFCGACRCILFLHSPVRSRQHRAQQPPPTPSSSTSVVAVVNKHAILSSDIDDEIRLSVLDPNLVGKGALTRQRRSIS